MKTDSKTTTLTLVCLWLALTTFPALAQVADSPPVLILTPEEREILAGRGITSERLAPKDDGRETAGVTAGSGYVPRTRTSLWHQWPFSKNPRPPVVALGNLTSDPWAMCFDLTGGFDVATCAAARPAIMAAHVSRYGRGPGVVKAGNFECWRVPDCAENRQTFRTLFLPTLALSCGHAEVARAAPTVATACGTGLWTMDRFSPKEQEDAAAFEAERLTDAARCILGLAAVFGNTCLSATPTVPPVTTPPAGGGGGGGGGASGVPPGPPALKLTAPAATVGDLVELRIDVSNAWLWPDAKATWSTCGSLSIVGVPIVGKDFVTVNARATKAGACSVSASIHGVRYLACSALSTYCVHGVTGVVNVAPKTTPPPTPPAPPPPPAAPPSSSACPDGYRDTGGRICPPGGGSCWIHCFRDEGS